MTWFWPIWGPKWGDFRIIPQTWDHFHTSSPLLPSSMHEITQSDTFSSVVGSLLHRRLLASQAAVAVVLSLFWPGPNCIMVWAQHINEHCRSAPFCLPPALTSSRSSRWISAKLLSVPDGDCSVGSAWPPGPPAPVTPFSVDGHVTTQAGAEERAKTRQASLFFGSRDLHKARMRLGFHDP